MLTTVKTGDIKPKKWDKLEGQLEDFIRSHMNQNGQITKSLSELFREFAKLTTLQLVQHLFIITIVD